MPASALVLLRTEPDTLRALLAGLGGNRRGFRLSVIGAACTHAVLVSFVGDARAPHRASAPRLPSIELFVEPPPAPAPPAVLEKPSEKPTSVPIARDARPAAARPIPREASPARAGAVLTQSAPDTPLDLTAEIVSGTSTRDPGGSTSARGVSASFSRAVAAVAPTRAGEKASVGGTGDGLDHSRGPSMIGGLSWNCPFPAAADVDGVNRAQVTLRVQVDASGRPTRVVASNDPGHGFAEAARSCAFRKRWLPGTDRSGLPSTTEISLNVRFVR